MPKVPQVEIKNFNGARIPEIRTVDVSILEQSSARAGRALADMGRSAANTMQAASQMNQRIQARKDDDAIKDAQADWDIARDRADLGYTDEDGRAVKGIRDYGVEDPARTPAWNKTVTEWRDNPDSPYSKLSPRAQKEFDRFFSVETNRLFDLASRHDTMIQDERRKQTDLAGMAAAERGVQAYVYNEDLFSDAAEDLADRAARLKAGRMIVNPEETDPGKLQFRDDIKNADGTVSGNTRTSFQAARAETLDKTRYTRALTLAAGAGTAEHESTAAARIDMAAQAAETLPPALKADALSALEAAKDKRLQGMLGLARAEPDLDKQESLVSVAERSATAYKAGGDLLGAVTKQANGIRSDALKLETEVAYEALALGKTYDPKDNPRMQAALKHAKPLFEKHQRQELSRTLTEQGEFIGNMVKSGFGFDRDGNVVARSVDERRSILRTHLAKGDLRGKKYMELTADLDKIEQSGKKPLYERISADVCASLGKEIKTAWKDSQTLLDEKEDPAKFVAHLSHDDPQVRVVPETVNDGFRTVPIGGGFQQIPQVRETGRMVEQTSVIRQKRDILARDVPKMIDLLMAAESANGLMVDLDDNPKTPSVKMDARAYKATLLQDIKKRVLAVDLDKQARGIFAAAALKERERKALEAAALTRNANLRLPAAATSTDELNTEDSYDY